MALSPVQIARLNTGLYGSWQTLHSAETSTVSSYSTSRAIDLTNPQAGQEIIEGVPFALIQVLPVGGSCTLTVGLRYDSDFSEPDGDGEIITSVDSVYRVASYGADLIDCLIDAVSTSVTVKIYVPHIEEV